MSRVTILMATYNGEAFLAQQVDNILRQTFTDWTLLISDDDSTDNTLALLNYCAQLDKRIQVISGRSHKQRSPLSNFSELMKHGLASASSIFAFCDQDDVWADNKLQRCLNAFSESAQHLVLLHHDLCVVDSARRVIHPSFFRFMKLAPNNAKLGLLLSRNIVTGCTMICNRSLVERAYPKPEQTIMHDWWLALFAASTGDILLLEEALVDYRQHSANTIGAKGFWHSLTIRTNWRKGWQRRNEAYIQTIIQARALAERFHAHNKTTNTFELHCAQRYASLPAQSLLEHLTTLYTYQFNRHHP